MPKPELERIDANDVVWRVARLHFPKLVRQKPHTRKGVDGDEQIGCAIDMSLDPMPLDADPELLHRALSNLVLNAMDAMPDGGTLTLSAHPKGEKWSCASPTPAQGLTPEECERLFTPYYTTKQHGTGLGLAIVQSVVADHAGTIAVESRAGAAQRLSLRCRRRRSMTAKANILIVDDEANTLASLSRAFRLAGHEAVVCDNASARWSWPAHSPST